MNPPTWSSQSLMALSLACLGGLACPSLPPKSVMDIGEPEGPAHHVDGMTVEDSDGNSSTPACWTHMECTLAQPARTPIACHGWRCVAGECAWLPQPRQSCDDGDQCTGPDLCTDTGICAGLPLLCDDLNPCTEGVCDPDDGCLFEALSAACDDGNPCTTQDYCVQGQCQGQTPACPPGNQCEAALCDEATGECSLLAIADGTPCDDGDPCTTTDRCTGGSCLGVPLACDDGLPCTMDVCELGQCHAVVEPGACVAAGDCLFPGEQPMDAPCQVCSLAGGMVPVSDGVPCEDDSISCTEDICVDGLCEHMDTPDSCHLPDGTCVGVGDLLTPCLTCQGGGIVSVDDGAPCDDGLSCTSDDICLASGLCEGTPLPCCPAQTPLECDTSVEGDTSGDDATATQLQYSCLPGGSYIKKEAHHSFNAPCTGTYEFSLSADSGIIVFFQRGTLSQCGDGDCESYSTVKVNAEMNEGEDAVLIIDGFNEGPYALNVVCPCAP